MTCIYEILPPNDQPSAPKKAKKGIRRCQSSRPDNRTAAIAASAPGTIAPNSWPKFPRMPQPIDRERAVNTNKPADDRRGGSTGFFKSKERRGQVKNPALPSEIHSFRSGQAAAGIGGKDMRCCANKNDRPDAWRQIIACLLSASLTPLATGCDTMRDSTMTGRLWDAGGVNRCLPAPTPNLKLYRTQDDKDVLVTYDELREKNDSIRRRAFFFKPNIRRLEDRKRPKFVNPDKVMKLKLVPVARFG